jgi:hypothetical protein
MRQGLRRAARILMAAGALGLARPAVARGPAVEAPAAAEEAALPAGQAYREEVRVRLAWLADPVTFPHALTARVRGDSLEVGGTVPDSAAQEAALKLARQHTPLPVVDAVQVRPAKAEKRVALPAEAVQRTAAGALSVAVGSRGRDVTVQARPDGQVTVRGSVASLEEKLRVSERLRQVAGCTSVVNCLSVAPPAPESPLPMRGPAGSMEEKLFVSQQLREAAGRPAPRQPAEEKATAPPNAATARVVSVTSAPAAPAANSSPLSHLAPSASAPEADLHLPAGGRTTALAPKAVPPEVVEEVPEAPAPAERKPAAAPPVAVSAAKPASYVVTAPQPAAPAYAASRPAVVPARLRQRVLAACGDQALAVQVLAAPDQPVRVRVRVASYAAQVQLTPRIMQLPEMKAPNVHLEIQVAP